MATHQDWTRKNKTMQTVTLSFLELKELLETYEDFGESDSVMQKLSVIKSSLSDGKSVNLEIENASFS